MLDSLYKWLDFVGGFTGREGDIAEQIASALIAIGSVDWPESLLSKLHFPPSGTHAPEVYSQIIAALPASVWSNLPRTKFFLLERAVQDADAGPRSTALLGWAQLSGKRQHALLLSRDVDGIAPGLDPLEPISAAHLQKVADRLGMTIEDVQSAYEALAREVPIQLSWQSS
jgi:hypothetical protein